MSRPTAALALFLAASLPPACARQAPPPDSSVERSGSGGTTDSNGIIQVQSGSEFEIVLESNATTGYRWHLANRASLRNVTLVGSEYEPDPAPPGIVGSGGKERWTFRADAPGEASIALAYARSWEKGQALRDTVFRVVVR